MSKDHDITTEEDRAKGLRRFVDKAGHVFVVNRIMDPNDEFYQTDEAFEERWRSLMNRPGGVRARLGSKDALHNRHNR